MPADIHLQAFLLYTLIAETAVPAVLATQLIINNPLFLKMVKHLVHMIYYRQQIKSTRKSKRKPRKPLLSLVMLSCPLHFPFSGDCPAY